MPTLTFDTGALVALQDGRRGRLGVAQLVRTAAAEGDIVLVSANVLAEWWRGGSRGQWDVLRLLKRSLRIQPVTEDVAKLAGEALGWYGRQHTGRSPERLTFDATVMATACLHGRKSHEEPAIIYTGDADMWDLTDFELFPNVVLRRT